MTWTNVLVPVLGGESDAQMLAIAKALAEPFDGTISAVFASMSPNIFSIWAGEAGVGPTGLAVADLVRSTEPSPSPGTAVGRLSERLGGRSRSCTMPTGLSF